MRTMIQNIKALVKGFAVTGKYLFKPAVTVQYPTERKPIPRRFRGLLFNDVPRCISCDLCAKACPVDCFTIVWDKGEKSKRILKQFDINMYKCMFCGLCTEVCPTECLTMDAGYEFATTERGELLFRFVPTEENPQTMFVEPQADAGGMIGSDVALRVNTTPKPAPKPAATPSAEPPQKRRGAAIEGPPATATDASPEASGDSSGGASQKNPRTLESNP